MGYTTFFESSAPQESISKELYFHSRDHKGRRAKMAALFALYLSPANTHENSSVTAISVKVTGISVAGYTGDMYSEHL
jgi:hypothetical protein